MTGWSAASWTRKLYCYLSYDSGEGEIPDVDFLMVEGGTHTTLVEHPELIHRTVRDFLENRLDS